MAKKDKLPENSSGHSKIFSYGEKQYAERMAFSSKRRAV
jgi:hypothetical protein